MAAKMYAVVVALYADSPEHAREIAGQCGGNPVHVHSMANEGDGTIVSAPYGSIAINRDRLERLIALIHEECGNPVTPSCAAWLEPGDLDPIP